MRRAALREEERVGDGMCVCGGGSSEGRGDVSMKTRGSEDGKHGLREEEHFEEGASLGAEGREVSLGPSRD